MLFLGGMTLMNRAHTVERLFLWLGAGLITVGVSAAMIAGAAVAGAEPNSAASGGATSSGTARPSNSATESGTVSDAGSQRPGSRSALRSSGGGAPASQAASPKRNATDSDHASTDGGRRPLAGPNSDASGGSAGASSETAVATLAGAEPTESYDAETVAATEAGAPANEDAAQAVEATELLAGAEALGRPARGDGGAIAPNQGGGNREPLAQVSNKSPAGPARARPDLHDVEESVVSQLQPGFVNSGSDAVATATAAPFEAVVAEHQPVTGGSLTDEVALSGHTVESTIAAATGPSAPVEDVASAPRRPWLLSQIGSAIITAVEAVERLVVGPPRLPSGSTVVVRSSTLEIRDERNVEANWYLPAGDEPPERMIYFQHGWLVSAPMYSYTMAYLTEETNSVVVAPTMSSNLFAADDFWLNGDPVHRAVAALFLGGRDALTASASAAGYTEIYGNGAMLPDRFVLGGHSFGGGTAAGAAGYYAQAIIDNGAANNLLGAVLFDAVPPRDALPDALAKLDGLKDYLPVLEIGAPPNFFNRSSDVNAELTESRPDKFNGVVLKGGTHTDPIQGANPLSQLAAYLVIGFPRPQNPPAVQTLAAGWINDLFEGRIDPSTGTCVGIACQGIYGNSGDTVEIGTAKGTARAVVIGEPVPVSVQGVGFFETMMMSDVHHCSSEGISEGITEDGDRLSSSGRERTACSRLKA